jgi:hypothetical protein
LSLGSFLEIGKHQPPFLDKVTYVDGLVAVPLAGSNLVAWRAKLAEERRSLKNSDIRIDPQRNRI